MSSMRSTIRPGDVVKALMKFEGKETKTIVGVERKYLKYKCPKPGCRNPVVSFLEGSGFHNPQQHLFTCYAKGKPKSEQISIVNKLYEHARTLSTTQGGTIRSHFNAFALSEYEQAMHGYLRLIVMKNLPLASIEDAEFRAFSKFKEHIGHHTLQAVIFKLVELVESRIAKEIENTKGAVMYDGWTSNNTHFIGVFLSYCSKISVRINGKDEFKHIPRITLIGVSPLAKKEDEEDNSLSEEATAFNAEAHLKYFRDIFEFYDADFDDWALCLIGDNCSTNLRIASLSSKPHIGCASHKLNLEVTLMVRNDIQLRNTITGVHETMKAAKTKLKSAAILRNITTLKPILYNKTRWSGKYEMIARFTKIRSQLIEASQDDDADIPMPAHLAYGTTVSKYEDMLSEIQVATKLLQKKESTLSESRYILDSLMETVSEDRNKAGTKFYKCKLGKKYIAADSRIVSNKNFESAVIKIQRDQTELMTAAEKSASVSLRKPCTTQSSQVQEQSDSSFLERYTKKSKLNSNEDPYINCDFILGSAAEVERLWSTCKYILCENRRRLTPQLFEALVFLKVNGRFWDAKMVSQATYNARNDRASLRFEAHVEHSRE